MSTLAPTMQPQSQFGRAGSASEGLEQQSGLQDQARTEEFEKDKKAMNNVWNAFLAPEAPAVSFTRLDTPSTNTVSESTPSYQYAAEPQEEKKLTFAEIYAKLQSETTEKKAEDSFGTHEVKEAQPDHVATPIVDEQPATKDEVVETEVEVQGTESTLEEHKSEKKQIGTIEFKNKAIGTSKEVLQQSMKIGKIGFKEGKEVVGAVSDLWKNFIGFREKKKDPKAKENAEKAAKRKANKQKFIGLLREGMSIYYAAMRKAIIELEVKLGVNVMGVEERNRVLGRNRNLSFQGNDSIYAIHQTAYEMAEQKRRQMAAQSGGSSGRGKASAGQIFRDKNLQGERSGGQNMMSAVG